MIACYGEALIDLFVSPYSQNSLRTDSQACLGGSVFNFCLAAQRQGLDSVYLNALSVDSFGRQFAHVLRKEGVQLDAQPCLEPTSIAVIQLDAQGKATYAFHRNGVADTARSAFDIITAWPSELQVLHTGCLMLAPASWPQTQLIMAHAAAQGCAISVDANLRPAVISDLDAYANCVRQACAQAHIIKVSDDDLVVLGALAAGEKENVQAALIAARSLLAASSSAQLIALTLGERGAWLLTSEQSVYQDAAKGIVVKDTVGAGDSFAAALLAHLNAQSLLAVAKLSQALTEESMQAALRHAVTAAGQCVQRVGCDPATWDETLNALK
jgi:fructokinase